MAATENRVAVEFAQPASGADHSKNLMNPRRPLSTEDHAFLKAWADQQRNAQEVEGSNGNILNIKGQLFNGGK